MSEINIIPLSIGRPIQYSKSCHSLSYPQKSSQKYFFELIINSNTPNKKVFRKLENSKHCDLILEKDNINYNDIINFKLSITKLPLDVNFNYYTEGLINKELSSYNHSDNEIYIEFSQNSFGKTFCRSSFIGIDFTKICVSPP